MEDENLKTRYNVMDIPSLDAFAKIKGGINHGCKDVYFIRAVGVNQTLAVELEKMDRTLSENMLAGRGRYYRVNHLPNLALAEEIACYSACYENWMKNGRKYVVTKVTEEREELKRVLGNACDVVARLFKGCTPHVNDSIEKNFVVKLLYWFDMVGAELMRDWDFRCSMKIVFSNIRKKQEYFFCYLLTLMGADILLLQCQSDIEEQLEKLELSKKIILGSFQECRIPPYNPCIYKETPVPEKADKEITHPVVDIRRLDRDLRTRAAVAESQRMARKPENIKVRENTGIRESIRSQEKDFEELALLASSVVMITIHDRKGDIIGSGSGIMVGRDGYILTNNHVASGGQFYSVRIEDEEEVYATDEVIKYNQVLDLAVIRINRTLCPLPVYKGGKELVRGQKVVAIGSPLGLFNSVSNGIISGFRKLDGVDMIQFTAPISHGSSGGAVLNMFGEVIGISTAGIDNGQNINLAVGYECINHFIRGFTY